MPGRPMARVLAVAAFELRDPIAIFILMEADNPAPHEATPEALLLALLIPSPRSGEGVEDRSHYRNIRASNSKRGGSPNLISWKSA